jgi:hypothetical protein
MEEDKKISLINRISTGIVFQSVEGKLYKLMPPDNEKKALSELVYQEILYNSKFDELITKDQASFFLQRKGIWLPTDEKSLEDLSKYTEDLKIALYKALYNMKEQKNLRRQISRVEKQAEKKIMAKHSLDYMTLENFSESIRDDFLIASCIVDSNGNNVYDYFNFWQSDSIVLNKFKNYLELNLVSATQYREIARSEPFRSSWSISKQNIFGTLSNLTIDQKNLILYSKMYDNVYEHPERPNQEVIDDDWMLDGWFAMKKREAEAERKKKEADEILDKKSGKGGDAGELFVVAGSKEEAQKISSLNDLGTQMRLKNRQQQIKSKGSVQEQDFADVKMDLRNEAMKQMSQRVKG